MRSDTPDHSARLVSRVSDDEAADTRDTVAPAAGPTAAPPRDVPGAAGRRLPRAAIGASLAVAVLLAALRVHPQVWGDPGVWLSVAARLLDGDRLYVDVFDNKDPLFFYSYAAALGVGGVRGPFVLEVIWLGVGTAGMALALRALRTGTVVMLAGALVYPFALTAAWYVPGATMVPALALAPVALWLWVRGSAFGAGAVVVVTMLLKFNLGLVVVAPLVALLALGPDGATRRRRAAQGVAGAGVALLLAAILLASRGELRAYVETLAYNVHYSNAGVHDGGVRAHVAVVRELFAAAGKWQLPAAVLAVASFTAVTVAGSLRLGRTFRRVSLAAAGTLAAALVTLALTAIFTVHLQLLSYPVALGVATFALAGRQLWRPLGAVAAVCCVAFAAWSSLKHEDLSHLTLRTWTTAPVSTPGLALEGTRQRLLPHATRVSYAVFGRNTEDGHAAFLHGSWRLTCRYFHQYPFYRENQLDETIDCARRERPLLILVTTSLYDPMPGEPRWERFVAQVRALLASRYRLVTEQGMSQVWRRR